MIASHYASPIDKVVVAGAPLRVAASDEAEEVAELEPEDPFSLLDDTLGWAWGYAGRDRELVTSGPKRWAADYISPRWRRIAYHRCTLA